MSVILTLNEILKGVLVGAGACFLLVLLGVTNPFWNMVLGFTLILGHFALENYARKTETQWIGRIIEGTSTPLAKAA